MADTSPSPHWWKDQFARLLITIIGGVVAALIITVVIPGLNNSSDPMDTTDPQTEQPAEPDDTPTTATPDPATATPDPTTAPAEGEGEGEGG